MKVCCLFEQSGTFKNVYLKRGDKCIDVDISNIFGETDLQIDLFTAIENDCLSWVNEYDLIYAFFPCTWFSINNDLIYRRQLPQFRKWSDNKVDEYINLRLKQYERVKSILLKLITIVKRPLIIENPRSKRIFEILGEPTFYIKDRSLHGDFLKKPTYFYCFNNVHISNLDIIKTDRGKDVNHLSKLKRSLISNKFAENFINHVEIN